MNTDLLLRVQQIDPAPPSDAIPSGVWDAQQMLEELQRQTETPTPPRLKARRPWLVAAAATAIVLAVLVPLLLFTGDREPDVVTTVPPTSAPEVTTVPPTSAPEATAVPAPRADSIDWSPIEGLAPKDMISDGNSFYVLADSGNETELLTSQDGTTWQRLAVVPFSHIDVARDGKVLSVDIEGTLSNGRYQPSITVYVVDAGGAVVESIVELTIPDRHALFVEGFTATGTLLGTDGVVITGSYFLNHDRIVAAGVGISLEDLPTADPEEELDRRLATVLGPLDELGEGGVSDTTVSIGGATVDLNDLGLNATELVFEVPVRSVSTNGVDWEQIEPVTEVFRGGPVTIDGGLVGYMYEVPDTIDEAPISRLSVSRDGIVWTPMPDVPSSSGGGELTAWSDRAIWVASGTIWAITTEGATQLNTPETEFSRAGFSAGGAGIATLTGFTRDGELWTTLQLPDDATGRGFTLAVGADGLVLVNQEQQAWFGSTTTLVPTQPPLTDDKPAPSELLDEALQRETVTSLHGEDVKDELEYIAAYLANETPWPEPMFDTTRLGVEHPLTAVDSAALTGLGSYAGNGNAPVVLHPFLAAAQLQGTSHAAAFRIDILFDGDVVTPDWSLSYSPNSDFSVDALLAFKRSGADWDPEVPNIIIVFGDMFPNGHSVIIGGLPPDASVVATTFADGTMVWQRPVSGIAILLDPNSRCVETTDESQCEGEYLVLDAEGNEILRIAPTPSGDFLVSSP